MADTTELTPARARELFPGLEGMTYFATNGQALLPAPARDRIVEAAGLLSARGYAGAARLEARVDAVREQVSRLLGSQPEEVAFVRNTGEGLCLAADLIDWKEGDEILVFDGEYRSIVHAFQGAAHRGAVVRVAAPDARGCVTPERVANELRERTRALVISWVRYDNGARADLEALGALLSRAGVLFVVDAIQGLGALPFDVRGAQVDLLAAGAHKWLLGTSGTGVLYIRRSLLPELVTTHLGVASMQDADAHHGVGDAYEVRPVEAARRVEEGSRNLLGIVALGASLELHEQLGGEAIAAQVKAVTDRLCEGFEGLGGRVRSPRGPGEWSGILLLEPPAGVDADALSERLIRQRVIIGSREGALWGGAHYFNDLNDADRLLEQVRVGG